MRFVRLLSVLTITLAFMSNAGAQAPAGGGGNVAEAVRR